MAKFFIERPIFAWVIAISIMLVGVLAIYNLPVAQYPNIAPPTIEINAYYPGASAQTVGDTVVQVIEQQMNGLDNLQYMSSTSDSSGEAKVTLTFKAGTNADIAQVQVQNKLQLAMPLLPSQVQQQGIRVSKAASSFLLVIGFVSVDNSMDGFDLADYVISNVKDPLSRVNGVGDVTVFGSQYAMRIWLNPDKLASYSLMPSDVEQAVLAQNAQVSAGQLGGAPAVKGQQLNVTITAQTKLQTVDEFKNIILRVNPDGSTVFLKDVARVEIGAESYDVLTRFDNAPATGMAIRLAAGANALNTADAVRDKLDEMKKFFPHGMEIVTVLDTTPFVRIAINEVVKTLLEAIVLVFLVMYLFLQNFRATLIPTLAVPVVLLGTFAVLAAFGFSINTLTMFAMVLAIGLLVDDAIVVVENVERIMSEEGLSPKEATKKSMGQITGALVGVAMVLTTVFIPMAFFSGSTGIIYKQFSITIVAAMVLSVIVAIVFTPALCATMLKPTKKGHGYATTGFFGVFNRYFDAFNRVYIRIVGGMFPRWVRSLGLYLVIIGALSVLFIRLPTSFLPEEDQGFLFTLVILPSGSTQEHTARVLEQVSSHYLTAEKDAVASALSVNGFSFAGNGQSMGMVFVRLKDWSERKSPELSAAAVAGRVNMNLSQIKDAMVYSVPPPAIMELSHATGFTLELQDRASLGHEELVKAWRMLKELIEEDARIKKKNGEAPIIGGIRRNGQDDTSQYSINVDVQKAGAFGLSLGDINHTIGSALGGNYINDFLDRGRTKKVFMQADAPFRMLPEDLNKWYVRNMKGDMVAFPSFASTAWGYGPPRLERYNGFPAMQIEGGATPGFSSGIAMLTMEKFVKQLPNGIGFEWTGMSFEEKNAGAQAPMLYAISLIFVFLCLAALYESWSIPLAVMLVVPLGVFGSVLAMTLRGLSNDVYFQVGLLTTVGLSAKNAILIVEFAKELFEQGRSLSEAALEAARMRLRPILMTSFAFMLGVLPLVISSGAGSGAQNALGTGVFGGMLSATVLAIFFVPLFFVLVEKLFDPKLRDKENTD
ncbi:efflux RND transporter permease subunit [Desulfovibrio litoralis]|uniref:Multidrug efflux pump n=1 Tax=Desulfovibrio litoralis DSM 11393 TaxID=1121455 RepID=A0A1M7T4B7_9BACT|nr:efflux RND transporter permease subunit [Desulfovibrio litoralis]SHN65548.1 multidrug efflux pump [Desulfovibrio litoralis DSM 11393]